MSLVAHYRLEDLTDAVGTNDLQIGNDQGDLQVVEAILGNGYQRPTQNGTDEYLVSNSGIFLNGDFTLSCWAFVSNAQSSANGLVSFHNHNDNTGSGITVKYVSSTDYRISCNTGNGTSRSYQTYYGTSNIKDRWAHLVVRYDSVAQMYSLWVDGVNEKEFSYDQYNVPDFLTIHNWSTGNTTSSNYRPACIIDDVRVYDHALSKREIRDLRLGPAVQEFTHELDNTTGTVDFITVEYAPTILGDTTIAFWVYPATTGPSRETIWDNGYCGEGTINFERGGSDLRFYSGPNGGNNAGYQQADSSSIPLGEWSHAVVVRDMASQQYRWYINGQLATTTNHSLTSIGGTTFDLRIGTGYTNTFVGKLRGVKQFATALTEDQINELYQQRASIDDQGSFHSSYIVEHLDNKPGLDVQVLSSGNDDGNNSHIYVGGLDYSYSRRGHNIAAFEPNGTFYSKANFDTHSWNWYEIDDDNVDTTADAAIAQQAMIDYLEAIPSGYYLMVSTDDQPQHGFQPVHDYFLDQGFLLEDQLGYRDGWAAITKVDSLWVLEDQSIRYSGIDAEVTHAIIASPSITDHTESPRFSEVAVPDGMVEWYPFDGDARNYTDGTRDYVINNGATPSSRGYYFDGTSFMDIGSPNVSTSPNIFTISMIIKPEDSGWLVSPLSAGVDHFVRYVGGTTEKVVFQICESSDTNNRNISSSTGSVPLNVESHVAFVINDNLLYVYVNGVLEAQSVETLPIASWTGSWDIGQRANGTYRYTGHIRDFRIYDRALPAEEIALLNNLTSTDSPQRGSMTKDTLYTTGQFKEVIT